MTKEEKIEHLKDMLIEADNRASTLLNIYDDVRELRNTIEEVKIMVEELLLGQD